MKKIDKTPIVFAILMTLAVIGLVTVLNISTTPEVKLTYAEFQEAVDNGKVKEIVIHERGPLSILFEDGTVAKAPNPESPTFKEEMLQKGVEKVSFVAKTNWFSIIFNILVWGLFLFFIFRFFVSNNKQTLNQMKTNIRSNDTNNKEIRSASFSDIAGIDEAKMELMEVVDYLKDPKKYVQMGIRPPKGVALYGPPGTGKTLLARATASEAGVSFLSVSGSDFVEMFVGVGAKRVRELFAEARKKAPCVVFIDEFDAIGKRRSRGNYSNDEREQTLNQLLVEMDGCGANLGIVVIIATNRLDMLDSAIVRPGRIDRLIEVGLPDVKGRYEILKVHAKNKPIAKDVDLMKVARRTIRFSGADLENLLNEAGMFAIRNKSKTITFEDIDNAFNRIIAGAKKKNNPLSEQEKELVAYHEAGHAIVARLLAKINVEKVTITPTGKALGYVLHSPNKEGEEFLKTKQSLFNEICIALGGRAAEIFLRGEDYVTTGASQDFRQATQIAYRMVANYGMSDLGPIAIDGEAEDMWMRLSDDIKNRAYEEVQKILRKAEKITQQFIEDHKFMLQDLANYLLEHETADSETLDSILSPKANVVVFDQPEMVALKENA